MYAHVIDNFIEPILLFIEYFFYRSFGIGTHPQIQRQNYKKRSRSVDLHTIETRLCKGTGLDMLKSGTNSLTSTQSLGELIVSTLQRHHSQYHVQLEPVIPFRFIIH